ncbi:MAG TPA: ATP-dependent DNA ligase [Candidatus Acidoferrales bacterium]|nr:ATP-dependent DNA ligase [Candidatus Acidoferrales bacterium]
MELPVNPPILPMLAKRVDDLPAGGTWIFEPKWDGFRALVFRDGDEIQIQSRDEKPLNRYFPELLETLHSQLPARCVLDGEIVIATDGGLDFEALQLRLHPAASRVKLLSKQIPSSIVFFDLLSEGDRDLRSEPFERRRQELERLLSSAAPPIHLTPATRELSVASDWFRRFEGAGLDGVMAKPISGTYESNKRVMLKVKHERDCDCVVAGFRWYKKGERTAVGSLLLGLFDDSGALQHVGVCASFSDAQRRDLVEFLAPYRQDALANHPWQKWGDQAGKRSAEDVPEGGEAGHRVPGGQSRWSQGKDLSWEPLRPELVVEIAYEHMQGTRFRHMAHFRRWRTDKKPGDCTYAELEVVPPQELAAIFARGH